MSAKRKKARSPNYSRQAKLLFAMCFLMHGSVNRAAKACGIPQRTANSWRERHPEEWDAILDEARAIRRGHAGSEEQDAIWKQLRGMIDKVATLGAAVSINELNRIHRVQVQKGGKGLTEKEREIAARLFGIGVDKAMAVRGIGRTGVDASAFDDFKDRLAGRIATLISEDPVTARKVHRVLSGQADGDGEPIDVNRLTIYRPVHPDARN